ncbi:MAG: 3-dehydroquinate synthase [Leptolyngbyaceae bacterium]|nr:3-dehydroquinate synthase [Leptolyngbyaceae bacterium]
MKSVITVKLPNQSYDVAIAPGGLEAIGPWLAGEGESLTNLPPTGKALGQRMLLVSNPTVFEHYGERAIASLTQAGFVVEPCLLPDGEQHKHLGSIQTIYDAALKHRLERSSTLVSLGGGVIGDMTGFAAATWLRGINFVQIPTSLLAMVDASIGGKTGVNHPQGKNLIGAFYQPRLVLIDPQVLATLPPREFRAGMAEVVKYGIIWDAELFEKLEAQPSLTEQSEVSEELMQIILTRSCQAKADVVGQDEKEAGLRAILNYGHTIGHAIESLTGYTRVNHGEAVAIGMVAAGKMAVQMSLWEEAAAQRQDQLLTKIALPTRAPAGLEFGAVMDTLQTDKKVKAGKVRFILPTRIGEVMITDQVSSEQVMTALQSVL